MPDGVLSGPQGNFVGHREIDDAIEKRLVQFPDFGFTAVGSAQCLENAGRLSWNFGPPARPSAVTGLDVISVKHDRIQALYTFLDPDWDEAMSDVQRSIEW